MFTFSWMLKNVRDLFYKKNSDKIKNHTFWWSYRRAVDVRKPWITDFRKNNLFIDGHRVPSVSVSSRTNWSSLI